MIQKRDKDAFNEFVLRYQGPVIDFIKSRGFSDHDAEDISQEIFMRIFKQDILTKADKAKGRFRDLILAITKNVIREEKRRFARQKRGAGKMIISTDQPVDESETRPIHIRDLISVRERDENFDRLWMLNILRIAFKRLREDSKEKELLHYEAIRLYLKGLNYLSIAERLGKSVDAIDKYIRSARAKLRDFIRDEIAFYSSSRGEYDDEIGYLSRYLEIR
jgi:RNA polymerase sigma-70 factor (ECF subfamily)